MKIKDKGLFRQIIILFAFGTMMIGLCTYFSQQVITDGSVKNQTEQVASSLADETIEAIREYPAYHWLIRYWRDNWDTMDIEYDACYGHGTKTQDKLKKLAEHQPEIELKYATTAEIEALPAEDQKLYAEIVYSWVTDRIDQIKHAHEISFIFCVLTDDAYDSQFFLLSGADPSDVRGTKYGQIYTLGVVSGVSASQQEGMKEARQQKRKLVDAGDYVDYYVYVETIDGQDLIIGMTYDLSQLNSYIYAQTRNGTIFAMILELLLAIICLILINRVVVRPLGVIQENIRIYMNSKNSKEVTENLAMVQPPNEIGQLSRNISEMTREIDDYLKRIKDITETQEKMKAELALATSIQTSMLPDMTPEISDRPEFEVFASMDPARDVGGDFYNYFLIDDDHLCLLIADVAGKGIPAAMFMMAAQIIFKDSATLDKSPSTILEGANKLICAKNKEDMFVTVWLGILEISTGKLIASNAGHEYPAIKRNGGDFEIFKDPHGAIVGGLEGMKYNEYEMELESGDWLFVYTDGVPEASDAEQKMFGLDRMIDALNETAESPEEILHNVKESVDEFTAGTEQFDDLTMLCLEYKGKA